MATRPIEERFRAAECIGRLDRVGDWDALMREFGAGALREYKEFLVVKALDGDYSVDEDSLKNAPGGKVDAVWHAHMQRPSHYHKCCRVLADEEDTLVDHDPATGSRADLETRREHTKRRLEDAFGPPEKRVAAQGFTITIFVKRISGLTQSLLLRSNVTVLYVKQRLRGQGWGEPDTQVLVYLNRRLSDERSLEDYGIGNESTIFFLQRLAGC